MVFVQSLESYFVLCSTLLFLIHSSWFLKESSQYILLFVESVHLVVKQSYHLPRTCVGLSKLVRHASISSFCQSLTNSGPLGLCSVLNSRHIAKTIFEYQACF